MNNSDNIAIYDIETILSINESVRPYLNALYGRAYERPDSKEPFKMASDFEFGVGLEEM